MPKTNPRRYYDPVRGTRTRAETARLIGCSVNMIDPLIESRRLQAIDVGNRRLIIVVSIETLLGRSLKELEAPLYAARADRQAQRHQSKSVGRRVKPRQPAPPAVPAA